jgi:hypothetical protein
VKEIKTAIYIEASPEQVWRALTHFDAYPQWNPFIRSVERTELAPGARWTVRLQMPGGGINTFRPVILRLIPAAELRWRGSLWIGGIFDGEHAFLMEPQRTGTQLTQSEKFSGLLSPLLFPLIATKTRQGFEQMNEGLKRIVEAKH